MCPSFASSMIDSVVRCMEKREDGDLTLMLISRSWLSPPGRGGQAFTEWKESLGRSGEFLCSNGLEHRHDCFLEVVAGGTAWEIEQLTTW